MRYHFAGREHWLTLGHYPDMSLAQARIEARQARVLVLLDKQQDPLSVRRAAEAERRQRGSFRELCEEWYRARVIDELKVRAPTAANDLLRFTRRIFAFGVRRRMVSINPAADFSQPLDGGGTERPCIRALSLGELAQLLEKVRETPSFGADSGLALGHV